MKKVILAYSVFLCTAHGLFSQSFNTYSEYFDYTRQYCPGSSQYDNWVKFINSMDTMTYKFLKLTIKGTYDTDGKTCTDKYAVRQIADAMYNRYDVSVQCDGNTWQVGTGCSDLNCGSYSDYVELTLNAFTCNCGVSYTIRPGITSRNWGGINTETCQGSAQNANQQMTLVMQQVNGRDNLTLKSLVPFNECENTQVITARVANVGTNLIYNYYIGYSINGVLQTPVAVNTSIASDAEALATISSSYTFTPGNTYQFRVWTYNPNNNADTETWNDTFLLAYKHTGVPAIPTASNIIHCGRGPVELSASTNDSVAWFDAPVGGNIVAIGQTCQSPFMNASDTFYAESVKFKDRKNGFGTGFNNFTVLSSDPSQYNGGMLKLSVNEVLRVSGIKLQSVFLNRFPHYKVYIREGDFAGYEKDSTAWERVFDAQLSQGGQFNIIPLQRVFKPGIDYSIYITTDPSSGEDVWVNYGAYSYSNPDIDVEGGTVVYGKFGTVGVYTPWTLNMEFIYEKSCVSQGRQPVVVTINPKPSGSDLSASQGFRGQFRKGDVQNPDIGVPGKLLKYEFSNPTGYANSGYGSTWEVNQVDVMTLAGQPVDTSLWSFDIPGLVNGKFMITPDNSILDSTIIVRIRCRDLGPYYCDTIITRIIHIAPVPGPNFKVLSTICEGSEIYFNNLSDIHSGDMSYTWYFGNGDSSTLTEPIYKFDSFGNYPVRLSVKSIPYGIVHDTTIVVTISGNPVAGFEVVNVCEGGIMEFINHTQGGGANYKWDFGDNTPVSTLPNPSHKYLDAGVYPVRLSADLNGCKDTFMRNAFMFPRPKADFGVTMGPVCLNKPVSFKNLSTISSGRMGALWYFDEGTYSTVPELDFMFSSPGNYDVELKMISEFGCVDSITRQVVIKPAPTVNFTMDKLCSRDTTHFRNLTTEFIGLSSSYQWIFSDGLVIHNRDIARKWSTHGPKSVKLKASTNNGCSAELEKVFAVLLQPESNFDVHDICSGENAVFVNKSRIDEGIMEFFWNFGDTSFSFSTNPKHRYLTPVARKYPVTLVSKVSGGCDDTLVKFIKVTELPDCGFTYIPFTLLGSKAFRFTPLNSTYTNYEWFFGEGGSSKEKSPVYQFLYGGNYFVTLKARNAGGCECEQLIRLDVHENSVDEVAQQYFSYYPNPAGEILHITLKQSASGVLRIYNNMGQLVYCNDLSEATDISIADLAQGLYIIEVETNAQRVQARLSVVR